METQRLLSPEQEPLSGSTKHPQYGSLHREGDSREANEHEEASSIKHPSPGDTALTGLQKTLLASMALVSALNGSLIAVMIPFFPVEAASRGVSQSVISAVFSCFAAVRMVMSPLVGRLVPFVGVTRLYNIGLAVAGVTTTVFGTLYLIEDTQMFVAACFLVRIVEAVGTAAVTVCGYTIASSQFPRRVNTAVSVLGSSLTIGLAFTPALWGGLYALGGFGTPFYTLGLVMLLMAAVNLRLMPAVGDSGRSGSNFCSRLRLFAGSTGNWVCLATVLMFSANVTTVESALAPYADDVLGVPPSRVGLYFLVAISLSSLVNLFWGWLAERLENHYILMSACLACSSVGILLIGPSPLLHLDPSWWLTGIGLTFAEVFLSGGFTPCFKTMLDASTANGLEDNITTQSFVASLFQTAFSLGVTVGPVSGGFIVDSYGYPVMITVLATLTALVSVLVGIKGVFTFVGQFKSSADSESASLLT